MYFNAIIAREFLKTSDNVVSRMRESSKKLTDRGIYEPIRQNLKALACSQFPNSDIEVHFFGSRVIGVATDQSDLDIFIEIENASRDDQEKNFKKIASAVEIDTNWHVKEQLLKTAIPIIICVYKPMNLNCDINNFDGLATVNSLLIRHLFNIQPEAISFYHFVRKWMKVQEKFKLPKGYTITLLVLYYLQTKNLMPSVENVQVGVHPTKFISGYESQFDPNCTLSSYGAEEMIDYKKHAPGFFKFYSKFNFDQVISTFHGKAVDINTYKQKYPDFLFMGIFIAGPLNKGRNCANDVNKDEFIDFCKSSSTFFEENKI